MYNVCFIRAVLANRLQVFCPTMIHADRDEASLQLPTTIYR